MQYRCLRILTLPDKTWWANKGDIIDVSEKELGEAPWLRRWLDNRAAPIRKGNEVPAEDVRPRPAAVAKPGEKAEPKKTKTAAERIEDIKTAAAANPNQPAVKKG